MGSDCSLAHKGICKPISEINRFDNRSTGHDQSFLRHRSDPEKEHIIKGRDRAGQRIPGDVDGRTMSRGRSSFGRGVVVVIGVSMGLAFLASDARAHVRHLIVLAPAVWAGPSGLAFVGSPSSLHRKTRCAVCRVSASHCALCRSFHPDLTGLLRGQAIS